MDEKTTQSTRTASPQAGVSAARRRLLRGGLGATPVLMTIASRPVSAATCVQASAFASFALATSRAPVSALPCQGQEPLWWRDYCTESDWPVRQNMLFRNAFGSPYQDGKDATLLDAVGFPSSSGREGLAKYLVAAYLNVKAGFISSEVLDEQILADLWASCETRGYYEPTAGVKWYPDYCEPSVLNGGIIPWLRAMMV